MEKVLFGFTIAAKITLFRPHLNENFGEIIDENLCEIAKNGKLKFKK